MHFMTMRYRLEDDHSRFGRLDLPFLYVDFTFYHDRNESFVSRGKVSAKVSPSTRGLGLLSFAV